MTDHENHELLQADCPDCEAILEENFQAFAPPRTTALTSDEREAMVNDRELMRDEFHT